jgi:CHASE3 domain sensor protein
MRNILMTVMLLIVVVVMFNTIIADSNSGTRKQIETQGNKANTRIGALNP